MTILYSGGYVEFPGTTGNDLRVANGPEFASLNDFTLIVKASMSDWTPPVFQALVAKYLSPDVTFGLFVWTDGSLLFVVTADGSTSLANFSAVLPAAAADEERVIAWTFDADNGAAGRTSRFFLSSDDGVSWTPAGSAVGEAGAITLFSGTAPLSIWSYESGQLSTTAGAVRHVSLRNGIGPGGTVGGTEVFRCDGEADLYGVSPSVATFPASTGQTVTVHRSGTPATTLVPPLYAASPAVKTLSVHAFDLVTGEPFGRLDAGQVKWSERLNGRLELSFRLDLAHRPSREMAPRLVDDAGRVRPIKVVVYDPPIAKSFILLEASYTDRRFLGLRGAGLWSWFAQFPLSDPFTFVQTDQHTIAATLLNWAQHPAQGGGIGVAVDNTLSSRLRDRTYNGFEHVPVGQRVDELAAVIDGFDFAIDTTFDGNITVVDTWRPQYPRAGRAWPESGIQIDADGTATALTVDWSTPTTDQREIGAGEGTDMLTATANDPTLTDYPPLWATENRKSVEEQATLQSHAGRDLQLANRRTQQWSVTVLDRFKLLKGLIVGDECQIAVGPGDFRWPDGYEAVQRAVGRTVNVDDDGGPDQVTLELENLDV